MSRTPRPPHPRLAVEALEDRTTPTFLPRAGGALGQNIVVNGATVPTGGLSVAAGDVIPDADSQFGFANNEYVTGTGPGTQAMVRVYAQDGTLLRSFAPFGDFQGGINVAVGHVISGLSGGPDLFGDPIVPEQIVVAVAGNGPPHVKVFSGDGVELSSFLAFDSGFSGGLNIAVGNVLGGVGTGGLPNDPANLLNTQEIIIGAAAGGSPHVVVADGNTGTILRSFLAFDLGYRGGVTVAAADIDTAPTAGFNNFTSVSDTNAYDEIIVGSAIGAAHVKAFSVDTGAIVQRLSFFAFDPGTSNGVTVAAGETDGERGAEIYVGQLGSVSPVVRVFGSSGQVRDAFQPFPALYTSVVNLAIANLSGFGSGFGYDPGFSPDALEQSLVAVAGDGPFFQQPRFFYSGFLGIPAGSTFGP